jgi:hypothetical protein
MAQKAATTTFESVAMTDIMPSVQSKITI